MQSNHFIALAFLFNLKWALKNQFGEDMLSFICIVFSDLKTPYWDSFCNIHFSSLWALCLIIFITVLSSLLPSFISIPCVSWVVLHFPSRPDGFLRFLYTISINTSSFISIVVVSLTPFMFRQMWFRFAALKWQKAWDEIFPQQDNLLFFWD